MVLSVLTALGVRAPIASGPSSRRKLWLFWGIGEVMIQLGVRVQGEVEMVELYETPLGVMWGMSVPGFGIGGFVSVLTRPRSRDARDWGLRQKDLRLQIHCGSTGQGN